MSLSVIVPAFNREGLIAPTLLSLLRQTLPADEIIVVDDGSCDGTEKAAWAAFHRWESTRVKSDMVTEFKVIRQENAGPAAARNRGFAESKGEFIHFFDSDDIAVSNKQEFQMRALQDTGADIAIGPWQKGFFEDGNFLPFQHALQQLGIPNCSLVEAILTNWSLVPHCCLFRREIVERAGGFPEDCYGTEDTFFFLSCLLSGAKCIHSPGTLLMYRLGNEKISCASDGGDRHLVEWAKVLIKMHDICLAKGLDPMRWFGFRARCWSVMRELDKRGLLHLAPVERLQKVAKGSPEIDYAVHGLMTRCFTGLKQRVVGNRASHPFRAGPLTRMQIAFIEEAGYRVVR
ncbi:MAG: glycosyltransferase family A protein [Cyanobacteria bacterium]|nr:glycosyltransferase family A protein [Cyanobacteriota bacterium]